MTHSCAQQKVLAEVRGLLSEMDINVEASTPLHKRTIEAKQTAAKSELIEL
jgi:hypothetical protein